MAFLRGVTSAQEKKSGGDGGNGVAKLSGAGLSRRWTRPSPGRILWGVGFLLALFSLAWMVVASRNSMEELEDASRSVTSTREVLQKLGEISTSLGEVESAARSFAIS